MKKAILIGFFAVCLLAASGLAAQEAEGLKMQGLEPSQIAQLARQGSLLVIKYDKTGKLKEVVSCAVVNASADQVYNTVIDFPSYPKFVPQTTDMKVIKKISDTQYQTEQTIKVEIWVLKVSVTYQHIQKLDPGKGIKFNWVSGDLEGTYGRYDVIDLGKNQSLLFYTVYSNLTALPWPIGPIMKAQPDFLTSVNCSVTSMNVKAFKEEAERRFAGK